MSDNSLPRSTAEPGMEQMLQDFDSSYSLGELADLLTEFNVFEAMWMARAEIRHSFFLAYLLNPRESHLLGDILARKLIASVTNMLSDYMCCVTDLPDAFHELEVYRERFRVDILLVDHPQKLVVIIENKIDTSEHSDQLARYLDVVKERYPDFSLLPIFLTPYGDIPSHPDYIPITYETVIEILVETLAEKDDIEPPVRLALEHYVTLLRRNIVGDARLIGLAQEIYRRHGEAIDYIVSHRQSRQKEIATILEELLDGTGLGLRHKASPKQGEHIQFLNSDWDIEALQSTWRPSRRLLLFQFVNVENMVKLELLVGPGPNPNRMRLLDHLREHGTPFSVPQTPLAYTVVYSKVLVHRDGLQLAPIEELRVDLAEAWQQFLDSDYPVIVNAINIERIIGSTI